jgi:iron only hydrogenase large subunit-like protein
LKLQKKPEEIYQTLERFFKEKLKATLVLDLWEGIELAHQLGFNEYLEQKGKTLLCSECPGWICYAEKTLTDQIVRLLSRVKSPQQVLARVVKEKLPKSLVLSIMPCYDKKLEAIRFDI